MSNLSEEELKASLERIEEILSQKHLSRTSYQQKGLADSMSSTLNHPIYASLPVLKRHLFLSTRNIKSSM